MYTVLQVSHTGSTVILLRGQNIVNRGAQRRREKKETNGKEDKNSSGDEIANVNFYAVRPGSYRNSLK